MIRSSTFLPCPNPFHCVTVSSGWQRGPRRAGQSLRSNLSTPLKSQSTYLRLGSESRKMTKVSVCITTYNRMEPLDRTLASLAEQTRLPDELIISDDCSPRDPVSVVEKWRDHFPN